MEEDLRLNDELLEIAYTLPKSRGGVVLPGHHYANENGINTKEGNQKRAADDWEDYVGKGKECARWKAMKPWLQKWLTDLILDPDNGYIGTDSSGTKKLIKPFILADFAAGIGIISFKVANLIFKILDDNKVEYDPEMIHLDLYEYWTPFIKKLCDRRDEKFEKKKERFSQKNVHIHSTSWTKAKGIAPHNSVSFGMIEGNSWSCNPTDEAKLQTLCNINRALEVGGELFIDVRVDASVRALMEEIEAMKSAKNRTLIEVLNGCNAGLYSTDMIIAVPEEAKENGAILYRYYRRKDIENLESGAMPDPEIARFEMEFLLESYPIELNELLRQTGFEVLDVIYDLDPSKKGGGGAIKSIRAKKIKDVALPETARESMTTSMGGSNTHSAGPHNGEGGGQLIREVTEDFQI